MKHLRKEGDVYVLLRPGFGKPQQFYFVAVQKDHEAVSDTNPKHRCGEIVVNLVAPQRLDRPALLECGERPAPRRILFEGEAYLRVDDGACRINYMLEELVEAKPYPGTESASEQPGMTYPVVLHDGIHAHEGLEVGLREGGDGMLTYLTYQGKGYQWYGTAGSPRHYYVVPEARPAGQRTFQHAG